MEEYEYPTDEQLDRIKQWDTLAIGVKPLVEYVESLWWAPDWGFKLRDGYIQWDRRRAKKLELHTGGWSGNEDIIGALRSSFFWFLYWQKSLRGGHYWFTIPLDSWEKVSETVAPQGKDE